jgi:hypothetical protein
LLTEEPEVEKLSTSAERRSAASAKLLLVRVEALKKRLTTTLPRRAVSTERPDTDEVRGGVEELGELLGAEAFEVEQVLAGPGHAGSPPRTT